MENVGTQIQLFNTDGRKKQQFVPLQNGAVGMYTCGLTVYNFAHIGNLRSYVFADTLKRMFLWNDYTVNHVMNITDVGHLSSDADEGEDKMLKGAKREGKTPYQIAQFYTDAFLNDMKQLNIISPTTLCKATDHIAEMIAMIQMLEQSGYTYQSNGNVYLDTNKVPNYGRLFGLNQNDEMQARVEQDVSKKNPRDFVLWFTRSKFQDQDMKWDSPWGVGYPGWHIECSAMATKYLGSHFDIHTGGIDHITVHHTNEIAQSECALGHAHEHTKWVNIWMHNEFLLIDEGKMSKSTGNFITLQTLIDQGFTPEDFRYFLLTAHYRKSIRFSLDALTNAKQSLSKIKEKVKEFVESGCSKTFDSTAHFKKTHAQNKHVTKYVTSFTEAINDDLNTPQALAVLWDVLGSNTLSVREKYDLVCAFDDVLALGLSKITKDSVPQEILLLVQEREDARLQKNWQRADQIRDQIQAKGYVILDGSDGAKVRKM